MSEPPVADGTAEVMADVEKRARDADSGAGCFAELDVRLPSEVTGAPRLQ
jgi:hypothetical protein